MKKNIIGIIGGGNMGEAFIKELCRSYTIHICEANPKRVKILKKRKYPIAYEKNISSLIAKTNIVILAVKPQEMESVLSQIKITKDKLFISIAAGLTTKYFEDRLGGNVKLIRAMPNLTALWAAGTTGFCSGHFVDNSDREKAEKILKVLSHQGGELFFFDEDEMDAVTAVSGSGPAYVFLFVEQWIDAAISLGFDEDIAKRLVLKTLTGSVYLLKNSGYTLSDLRAMVTSKGGTTQAAMDVFSKGKFDQLMKKALLAAKKRAGELAK